MKSLGNSWACINFHKKSRNAKFSSRGSPNYKRVPSGATRWAGKSVLKPKKIQNWQNFLQICWNLDGRSITKYHAQPKKPRPRFRAYHAFCVVLLLSLVLPSGFWSSLCKHDFVPNNGFSCAWACPCPCFPSPTASQDECWSSQAKSLDQPLPLAQVKWALPSSFRAVLAIFLYVFATSMRPPWFMYLCGRVTVCFFFMIIWQIRCHLC